MKKVLFILGLMIASNVVFGGGIVTNTNQGTTWTRMLVRDASTEVDAVFFNPAGLTKLSDGLHLSISNQTINQNMSIENSALNKTFEGKVFAPFFPNIYAAYKTGKFAFSLGFTPIGGGGSASYEKGVPMIELPVAATAKQLEAVGVKGYSMNASFDGSSVYFGLQAGVSYEINEILSLFGGARYVWVKNTYNGEMKDIMFNTASGAMPADDLMNGIASKAQQGAAGAALAASSMRPLIDNKLGKLTFATAEGMGVIDATTRAKLEAGLKGLGLTQAQIDAMNIETAQATFQNGSEQLSQQATKLKVGAMLFGGQEAEVEQTGSGVTPIVGVNLSLLEEKLNIGIKYEFHTNIELTNKTPKGKGFTVGFSPDGKAIEMFPDGKKTDSDIPALLSVGIAYKITDDFTAQIGYHTYFDKKLGWANEEQNGKNVNIIDKNLWEIGLGLEYNITDAILVSAGFLRGQTGVAETYHNDMRFSLLSNTIGLGGAYKINDMLKLQLGGFYVMYDDKTVKYSDYNQIYKKSNLAFSIGLDLTFGN